MMSKAELVTEEIAEEAVANETIEGGAVIVIPEVAGLEMEGDVALATQEGEGADCVTMETKKIEMVAMIEKILSKETYPTTIGVTTEEILVVGVVVIEGVEFLEEFYLDHLVCIKGRPALFQCHHLIIFFLATINLDKFHTHVS